MSHKIEPSAKSTVVEEADPLECPFREFRDNELQVETWGLGTGAFRAHQAPPSLASSKALPHEASRFWVDDQTQPLPRSVRHYLHSWIRAEELAKERWGAEVVIFDENDGGKMVVADIQLCHAQVLFRSSFCRNVLSTCFILERVEGLIVEHQWELFTCSFVPDGWRPKYHIYSPGLKAGGGMQHKPVLSKNGCYLVRLFYLGCWRCIWVNDQVPIDTSGAPLLPFSPLFTHPPPKPGSTKEPAAVSSNVIYLWPLLLTKALLKLAAPDMNLDEETDDVEDEPMTELDLMNALTGSMNIRYYIPGAPELWTCITAEVPLFSWDDNEDNHSTIKTKSTKKTAKELATVIRRSNMMYAILRDTKDLPPYHLPGITPSHEMCMLISMARDLPLKKPLPEPVVALWKIHRWVDWAKSHGLYAAYDCPRTKFLKVNGLMKLSYAPHLLDVQSTESITKGFIAENKNATKELEDAEFPKKKKTKEQTKAAAQATFNQIQQLKEELREWVQYGTFQPLVDHVGVVYYPSSFNCTSAGNKPPIRIHTQSKDTTKTASPKITDIIAAPKYGPLYLQLDGPEKTNIKISLSTMHARILFNSGSQTIDDTEASHLILEKFEWFKETALPDVKAYVSTSGHQTLQIDLEAGRHFLRIWTHSLINWNIMILSESTLLLGARDVILGAAVLECPWTSKFLLNLRSAFSSWIKVSRAGQNVILADREFFRSYLPDLIWDKTEVGYDRHLLHWMFRQALQSHLSKYMNQIEWKAASNVLRKYFCDPDFGFPEKPRPPRSLREITNLEICDCLMPEVEEVEIMEEQVEAEETEQKDEEVKPLVTPSTMAKLLMAPETPIASQVCDLATEELPCAILKEEREKVIRKHEAATILQAHWRGAWARRCLRSNITITADVAKCLQDRAFGNLDALSRLMNEFFGMWPSTKHAYSVASGLSGVLGLHRHTGMTKVTHKCKWIPFFQGVFYCHAPVKVHFDIESSIAHSTMTVYNNETGEQMPQAFNAHFTFDFSPNLLGYTVLGHGTLTQVSGIVHDAYWHLTVMSSISHVFHICDNDDPCKEIPLSHSSKIHIDEIFLPNRKNILGGIQISVNKHESVSFRAAASSLDLEMVATLRSILPDGETEEISKCSGKGEIYWPYIQLEANIRQARSVSSINTSKSRKDLKSTRSLFKTSKSQKNVHNSKHRSTTRLRTILEPKIYSIEVICPKGWPLTVDQWKRVDEVRNSYEHTQIGLQTEKKASKEKEKPGKPVSAKDKPVEMTMLVMQPQPGDAYVELECALAVGGGAVAKRDDKRDQEYANAISSWQSFEPGRNQRGLQIRNEFRAEHLIAPPTMPSESRSTSYTSILNDEATLFENTDLDENNESAQMQRPSLVSETDMLEMTVELEEELTYLVMPDFLRDKFIPLDFLPLCMKEDNGEERVFVSADMAEAAKKERHAHIEAAFDRMRELQAFNEEHVMHRQKYRCQMLEKLFVDANLCPDLKKAIEQKREVIAQEVLERNLSATKKKMNTKKKK